MGCDDYNSCAEDELSRMLPPPSSNIRISRPNLNLNLGAEQWILPSSEEQQPPEMTSSSDDVITRRKILNNNEMIKNPAKIPKNTIIKKFGGLWNEDFSHRPSWCDAYLALKQIKRKRAKGNKLALYLRAGLQHVLFKLGCFIQTHYREFIFIGILLMCLFCWGLQHARIETNIDKLWVEEGGRLDEERKFLAETFSSGSDSGFFHASSSSSSSSSTNSETGGGATSSATANQSRGGNGGGGGSTNTAQYLVLIQTPSPDHNGDILTQEELLLHVKVLQEISQMTVDLYGEKWSLTDICFKPEPPTIEGEMAGVFQKFVDNIVPCIMLTPLDCFWEGSLALGPFPPIELPDMLMWLIPSLSKKISWKMLDPMAVIDDLVEHMHLSEMQTIKSLFIRAGVDHGYLRRACIDPLNPDCPDSASNYVDICPVVENFIKWNNEQGYVEELIDRSMDPSTTTTTTISSTTTSSTASYSETTPNNNKNKKWNVNPIVNNNSSNNSHVTFENDNVTSLLDDNGTAEVKVLDIFGVLEQSDGDDDISSRNNNNGISSSHDDISGHHDISKNSDTIDNNNNNHLNDEDDPQPLCSKHQAKVRNLLKNDKFLLEKFLPHLADGRKKNFGREVTGGCSGFAQKFMHWPEDLIIGGIHREGNRIVKAEALQTVLMITSANDLYQRMKFGGGQKKTLNRYDWSPEAADQVLTAWQRNFTHFVYNHANNSQSGRSSNQKRQLHPLAGTSINDMMTEFSKFNPTVIIVGYIFMILYASLSLLSFEGRGVKSGVGLAISGCLLVTLAGLAGLGCSMMLGIAFNAATTQIVPFLALGLGVDDMFLLVYNYVQIIQIVDRREIGFLLKETGLSALLTSLNNIVAFLAGAVLPVPALRDFCLQVAILLIFNVVTILTVYPAILSVDLIRRKHKRLDVLCCIKAGGGGGRDKVQPAKKVLSSNSSRSPLSSPTNDEYCCGDAAIGPPNDDDEVGGAKNGGKKLVLRQRPDLLAHSLYHYDNDEFVVNTRCLKCCCCGGGGACCVDERRSCSTPIGRSSLLVTCSSKSTNPVKAGGAVDRSEPPTPVSPTSNGISDEEDHVFSTIKNGRGMGSGRCLTKASDWTLQQLLEHYYAKCLTKPPVKVLILFLHVCLVCLGIVGCNHIKLGLELTDVIPKGTPPYAFLDARQSYFSFYPFNVVLKGPLDVARNQLLMRQYRDAILRIPYVLKSNEGSDLAGVQGKGGGLNQFWLELMSEWLSDLQAKFDQDWEAGLITRYGLAHNKSQQASADAILAYKLLCNVGDDVQCMYRVGNTRLVDSDGLINPDGFYNYLTAWFRVDPMTYYVSQANLYPPPPQWKYDDKLKPDNIKIPPAPMPIYSQIPFFLNNLIDTPSIVDMIKEVRSVCDEFSARGLENFPEGIPFTFWEQYLHLKQNLLLAIAIVIGAVFIVISILLMNPWTAFLVVIVLIMLVIELAGFMGLTGLKLNAVSAVSLITAIGIGVEFTVHVSLSFLTTLGTKDQRVTKTLQHMAVPVLHGGLSTLLGVIMLAFSEFEFVFRYFFMVLSALIVLGLFNGLCLLPVFLSLIGPRSEVRTTDGSDSLSPPTPPPSPPPSGGGQPIRRGQQQQQHQSPHHVTVEGGGVTGADQSRSTTTTGREGGATATTTESSSTNQQQQQKKGGYHRHSDSLSTIVEEQEPSAASSVTPSSFLKVTGAKVVYPKNSAGSQIVNSPVNVTNNIKVNVHFADKLADQCQKWKSTANKMINSKNIVETVGAGLSQAGLGLSQAGSGLSQAASGYVSSVSTSADKIYRSQVVNRSANDDDNKKLINDSISGSSGNNSGQRVKRSTDSASNAYDDNDIDDDNVDDDNLENNRVNDASRIDTSPIDRLNRNDVIVNSSSSNVNCEVNSSMSQLTPKKTKKSIIIPSSANTSKKGGGADNPATVIA